MRRTLPILLLLPLLHAAHAADWPMARGGPDLRGLADGTLATPLALRWTFKTTNAVKSSAAIAAGTVFIGSDDGNLYALDLASGAKRWAFKTDGRIEATPLVLDGTVYVGAADFKLHAIDAKTGTEKWSYATEDKILGGANWFRSRTGAAALLPPNAGDRSVAPPGATGALRILVGSYDFKVHCVDAATGAKVWTFETSNYVNGTPAVAEGRVVFGGCDGNLHAVDAETGREIASIEAGAYIAGSPALVGPRAYAGHFGEEVLCADLPASNMIWRAKQPNAAFFSSPAVTASQVLLGGRDKHLHAFDRETGRPLWSFAARGDIDSSPVVCGALVVVGSEDGRLYVLDVATGKLAWSYEIGKPIPGSPAVADGVVVVGSEDGTVYAFGPPREAAK